MINGKTNGKFIKPKKDYSDLMESPYVKIWLEDVKTKQGRLAVLKRYCEFIEKTPDELILEHHEDTIKKPLERTKIAKKQLRSYFGYLTADADEKFSNLINKKVIEKSISWNSARQYAYSKLASFYKRNEVEITFQKKEIPKHKGGSTGKTWKQEGKIITLINRKEGLKDIVNAFNTVRGRTIVLSKISSGLDDADLFNLKVKNFNEGYNIENYEVCYIEGNRKKTDVYFQTYFNTEACKSIKLMLQDRERKGEVITDDSWLFVGNKKVEKTIKGKKVMKYTQMKPVVFYNDLIKICKTLKITNITPKSFRRYFNETIKEGLDTNEAEKAERMMGHEIGVKSAYQPMYNSKQLFTVWYVEHIEHKTLLFTVNGRITKLDGRIKDLEEKNEQLKEDNIAIKEQLKEQEQYRKGMREEMNKLRDWIGVDDDEVKAYLKERHQKLKKEKGK